MVEDIVAEAKAEMAEAHKETAGPEGGVGV